MDFGNIRSGLVSISFRKLSAGDLIEEVVKAGQQGVEWGGDVHVPHGDTAKAEQVARWMGDAGLESAAYGSYYRLAEADSPEIEAVLDAAEALGTSTVRVWAGKKASADADEAYRDAVKADTRRICSLAAKQNLRIAFEYHGNTLTDSIDSAGELLNDLQIDNLDSLWQPPNGQPEEICEKSLQAILPRISNVHVFHWGKGFMDRYALAEGKTRWQRYFELLQAEQKPRWALMEFVKDDALAQYHEDAKVLAEILKKG
ncbi:TIM barrel protein [Kiritimatiellaeota bacterium B1221]|nr:TIM barrel protein [Kiritimatiellaeota bacterium B1221]